MRGRGSAFESVAHVLALRTMAKGAANKRRPKVLSLDPDRLGMLGATALATVVLAVGLFVREAEIAETFVRAGIAFAVCYAAVFVLVYIIRTINTAESERLKEEERQRLLAQKKAESEATPGEEE